VRCGEEKREKEVATCSAAILTFCARGSVGQTKDAKPHASMNMQQRFAAEAARPYLPCLRHGGAGTGTACFTSHLFLLKFIVNVHLSG